MTSDVRIIAFGATASDLEWLKEGFEKMSQDTWVLQLHYEDEESGAADAVGSDFSILILDESLGIESARNLLTAPLLEFPSKPLLIGVSDNYDPVWDQLIRQGAQDFLLKSADSPSMMRRTILYAIDRANILEATQEAEIRLRTIIENIEDGVLILDEDGAVMFANPATEHLLGRSLEDIYGLEAPFEIPKKANDFITIEHPDGEKVTFHIHVNSIRWEGRESNLITLRDVTAEREIGEQLTLARKKAEEAAAMKGAFLANMSHELRMPLASIIGFAQLIEEGVANKDFKEFASLIQESGNRLLSTINSVLEATRLDRHFIEPKLEEIRVDTLIISTIKLLQPLVGSSKVVLSCQGTDEPVATADRSFLERILNNLIGNAAKFTDEGSIKVRWGYQDQYVRIDITDTGIGMDPDFLPQVFDEFSQESTGHGRSFEGSGLGLAIVKGLVDLMKGQIEIESTKGEGTSFSVYIPRADLQS